MPPSPLYSSQLSGSDIRLLHIEPGVAESTLQCSLLRTSEVDASPYYALSYVWGDDPNRKLIMCNGGLVEVTTNLYSVLHEHRQRAVPMRLWVDALCIHQSDDEERTSQVRIMEESYTEADKVIIWLGEMHEHDEMAINTLQLINAPWATFQGLPLFTGQDAASYDVWLANTLSNQSLLAVTLFLQRPWFQRIWIVQELVSARSITVWCGPLDMDPDIVLSGAARCFSLQNVNILVQIMTANQSGISRLQLGCAGRLETLRQVNGHMSLGVYELLILTRYFQSTEPRNKMFALVGLASDIDAGFVDYSLDFRSVSINLSKRFLTGRTQSPEHPLDILSCVSNNFY
ncbi:Nn.00g020750.m01.CDS01 [Neocucurbitaria sp. VM-36]